MTRHVVTFRFLGTPEERRQIATRFRDALVALPAEIECLKAIQVGINENPAEQWDLTLIADADSPEDIAAYSAHPAHLAAVEIIKGHKADRACVDYTIER